MGVPTFFQNVLITGGSGFVGSILTPLLAEQSKSCVVIGRSKSGNFGEEIEYVQHDVCLPFDLAPCFDMIVHAATPASAALNASSPRQMLEVILGGTSNVIEFAQRHKNPPTILFLSSGAVYGEVPSSEFLIREDSCHAPSTLQTRSAYGEGKRMSELMFSIAQSEGICRTIIARLFAFSGPRIPLDRHFAIGNFVRDAVLDQHIVVRGDGRSLRSYLDEQDLGRWLMASIRLGQSDFALHIGSERSISIGNLAELTADRYQRLTSRECSVSVLGKETPIDGVSRYVPSTSRTRRLLGAAEQVTLEDSLDSMILNALQLI